MTTITNLVVALMIVTSGEEPVKAMPIQTSCDDVWMVQSYGQTETLYRKTCTTNFVYSTDINVDLIRTSCNLDWCMNEHRFTAEELFGKRIQHIFFYYDDPIYCEKHKSLKHVVPCYKNVKTGGAK